MSMNHKTILELLTEITEPELKECVKEAVALYDTGRSPGNRMDELAAKFDFLPRGSAQKLVERHALQYAAKQWMKGEQ